MRKKVREHEGWFKDMVSGTVDCGDTSQYAKYMMSVKSDEKKRLEMEALQNDVSGLKSEIGEIKSLILTLVQNQKG
jgi:hypothetical protein